MNFIYTDSSTNNICTIIGFYFEGNNDLNNLTHYKVQQCNLKVNRLCTVEAEFRAILLAVDFIRLLIDRFGDRFPIVANQRFTIFTDCKTTNDTIHNTPNQHKNGYCFELLREFRSKVKGLNISVVWISRNNNKAHRIVYNESRRRYNRYMDSVRIKGNDQSTVLAESKKIESQWIKYLQL